MCEAKPIFKKETLLYEREEKEGYWTFLSKLHAETRELIVNPTGKEILALCDGLRTLKEIEDTMKSKYPNADHKVIKMDVAKTIASFSRLGVIEWSGDNPFLYRKEEPVSDELSLMIGQEQDLSKIVDFIRTFIDARPAVSNSSCFLYKSPFLKSREYSEVALRQKLFAYNEEFFLLLRKGEIAGIIAFEIPILANTTSVTIKLAISPAEYFSDLLKYAQDNFPLLAVRPMTKTRLFELLKEPLDEDLKNALLKEKYQEEGVLRNEFGFGNDARIWARSYDKKLIESFKKRVNGGD